MTTPRYAVNEFDHVTVYDTTTQGAICVCGPTLDEVVWPDEQVQRMHAVLIAKLLNEAAQP